MMQSLPTLPKSDFNRNHRSGAALVIGAGIAGIQAALDIADAGFKVYLVERSSSIGGRMAQLDKTFPTLDCSSCILTPKMADVPRHPNITLLTCTEVKEVQGEAGDFHVKLERQPRYVDVESCTGCGLCAEACPVSLPGTFNAGLDMHKAIYRNFPQAVPAAFVIEKRASPCKSACPAHIPVQGYIALIGEGKFKQAYQRVLDAGVPFVGTLGRVCYHPCEETCKRAAWDEPVSICALKRFAYDASISDELPLPAPVRWGERVAIIGAGPAGLTAGCQLRRLGYSVTVFDAMPVAGGMLAAGIPAYRLPRDVLHREIEQICALGVELRLNTPVCLNGGPSLKDLQREFQAVFLAVGAQGSSHLGIPGEELQGVWQALPFLKAINLGHPMQVGRRVVVIGGGNSAIDAARSALRLGAQVSLLYRRSRAEMPAAKVEVAAAEDEGVELIFLAAPVRLLETQGRVNRIECIRMQLGEPDSSGRRRPVPMPGTEFTLPAETVIVATGQTVEAVGYGIELNRGRLAVDPVTLETNIAGVFGGGDAVLGPSTVVEAVGTGIVAAESIHRYLRGMDLRSNRPTAWTKPEEIFVEPVFPVRFHARERMRELPISERLAGDDVKQRFREVELGLTAEQAVAEARRCLSCAICSECMQCVAVCQRGAILHDQLAESIAVEAGAIIVATGFDVFDPHRKPELGYGNYPEVITSLEFERLASASGPTAGKIILNGRVPEKIVFIQCVGSRDQAGKRNGDTDGRDFNEYDGPALYCSRVCCMAVAKQAHLAHDRLPGAEITVFYMDVRAFGKGFEEFYDRVRKEGIVYRRGNPSEILRRGERLIVRAEDTLLGELIEVEADLVVLAVGMLPSHNTTNLAQTLHLKLGEDGFFQEAHPKLGLVESSREGIFLAGCCQGPKDIPDTVAQAKAAACAAMILLTQKDHAKILKVGVERIGVSDHEGVGQ